MVPVAIISFVMSSIAIVVLAPRYGVTGAAIGTVVGLVASTLGYLLSHLLHSRRNAEEIWNAKAATSTEPEFHHPTPATLTPGTYAADDVELAVIVADPPQ
jgi:hypothetical protein